MTTLLSGGVSLSNKVCAREGCENQWEKSKIHNQKYCSDECCRIATNKRIMDKYYERKEMLSGKVRYCVKCNESKLSRYNMSNTCAACENKKETQANNLIIGMLKSIVVE